MLDMNRRKFLTTATIASTAALLNPTFAFSKDKEIWPCQVPESTFISKDCFWTAKILKIDDKSEFCSRSLIQKMVDEYKFNRFSKLEMPKSPESWRSNTQLEEAALFCKELYIIGNHLIADIITLNTPDGRILKSLLNDGLTALRTSIIGEYKDEHIAPFPHLLTPVFTGMRLHGIHSVSLDKALPL